MIDGCLSVAGTDGEMEVRSRSGPCTQVPLATGQAPVGRQPISGRRPAADVLM